MTRIISFAIFFTVFSAILFSVHYFVYQVMAKNLGFPLKILNILKWIFIISGLSIVAGQVLSRFFHFELIRHYGYSWLGFISITFSVFLVAMLIKLFIPSASKTVVLVALIMAIGISVYSILNQLRQPVIRTIEISTKKPTGKEGELRIVQISDLHVDGATSIKKMMQLADRVNSLSPHMILITGDLVDGPIDKNNGINRVLSSLRAEYGVFAISGNHEYYSGLGNFIELAERNGIKLIFDQKIELNGNLSLYGLSDPESAAARRMAWSHDLFNDIDINKFNILIGHRPYGFDKLSEMGIDLQLAGHTHAGQIPPMDLLVQLVYKYPYGLYRKGNSFLYTSSGTGVWGPPMRFLSRSEIVLLNIKRPDSRPAETVN